MEPTDRWGRETRDYRIEHGDTLSELAQRFGVTIAELMAANPHIKNPHLIYAGDVLRLPKRPQRKRQNGKDDERASD